MTAERSAASTAVHAARHAAKLLVRAGRAFAILSPERRMAAISCCGLFLTLFLPWYQETLVVAGAKRPQAATASLTGWAAFSFVEASVLLVAVAVLALLFHRAEGRAFHIPGGDGGVIAAAGCWTCALVVWRIFDKQGTSTHATSVSASGIEWGIFVALVVAGLLAYSGLRIRAAHQPEPPLPGESRSPTSGPQEPRASRPAPRRGEGEPGRGRAEHGDQLTIPLAGDELSGSGPARP